MMRKLWKSWNGGEFEEQHCGNCYWGVKATQIRKSVVTGCKFPAKVRRSNGRMKVVSRCSGIESVYDAGVVLER